MTLAIIAITVLLNGISIIILAITSVKQHKIQEQMEKQMTELWSYLHKSLDTGDQDLETLRRTLVKLHQKGA